MLSQSAADWAGIQRRQAVVPESRQSCQVRSNHASRGSTSGVGQPPLLKRRRASQAASKRRDTRLLPVSTVAPRSA